MAEELKAEDLRIDTYYAGEHSGFLHTNQTAVRITHLPTGVFVESKDERSVHANKQRCLDLLPEAIASMNTRAQQSSQWGEAVAWRRRDGVMGCKRFMTQKCYDAQSPQMKGYYEPFYCAHCVSGKSSPAAKFTLGDRVRKTKGSQWQGTVVGTYSTALTPEGYAVESGTELGSVQIYPAAALEACE